MRFVNYELGDNDGLRKEVWRYWFDVGEMRLILVAYAVLERPDRRSNFKSTSEWAHGNRAYGEEAPPPPEGARADVLQQFVKRIEVE